LADRGASAAGRARTRRIGVLMPGDENDPEEKRRLFCNERSRQSSSSVRRIGVLMLGDESDPERKAFVSALIQALADSGGAKTMTRAFEGRLCRE
jgi:hypothetical protein